MLQKWYIFLRCEAEAELSLEAIGLSNFTQSRLRNEIAKPFINASCRCVFSLIPLAGYKMQMRPLKRGYRQMAGASKAVTVALSFFCLLDCSDTEGRAMQKRLSRAGMPKQACAKIVTPPGFVSLSSHYIQRFSVWSPCRWKWRWGL